MNDLHRQIVCSIQFNSVYFVQPKIKNYKFASKGLIICTHTTSLTFDLTSDQEKLPRNRKNPFTGKKGEEPSREQQRRIPLQDGQNYRCHVTRRKNYRVTTQSMSMTECMTVLNKLSFLCWPKRERHAPFTGEKDTPPSPPIELRWRVSSFWFLRVQNLQAGMTHCFV